MPTLLIVDDIPGIHDMLDLVFEGKGITLEHALDGSKALEIYQSREIDLVLCDVVMPGMDGLELLKSLKAIDADSVVIMMTASESREYVIQALRFGALDYIEKPYDEQTLLEHVQRGFDERKKRLKQSGAGAADPQEIEQLKAQLMEKERTVEVYEKREAEMNQLKAELDAQKDSLKSSQKKQKELDKMRMELEVREGALQTMESVVKERMASLKKAENEKKQTRGGLSNEEAEKLKAMAEDLHSREQQLHELESGIQEREAFITETEESLMEKGMRLQELETELEQMKEDLEKHGDSGGVSPEQAKEMESLQAKLDEKERAFKDMEQKMRDKERAIRKAEALVKAREQFLAQSEAILLGEENSAS